MLKIIGAISIFCGMMSLVFKVFNVGVVALIVFGIISILTSIFWNKFDGWGSVPRRLHEVSDLRCPKTPKWWKRLRMSICIFLIFFMIGGGIISTAMSAAIYNQPSSNATVIVLGCKIYGDKPSLMLQRRLDVALEYLANYPNTSVICSGGKGAQEAFSEAFVMEKYLIENGIAQNRIFLEDTSVSTKENIACSAKIILENHLSQELAIATDAFHELRAQIYAKQYHLQGKSIPAVTPWGIAPAYWVREWFGIARALVVG